MLSKLLGKVILRSHKGWLQIKHAQIKWHNLSLVTNLPGFLTKQTQIENQNLYNKGLNRYGHNQLNIKLPKKESLLRNA